MSRAPGDSGRPNETKGKLSGPRYIPEPEITGTTPDLFALVDLVDEWSLAKRLAQLGADVYCAGNFPTHRDRLRYVIVREDLATAISGRDAAGKVERVAQAFERVTGEPLRRKAQAPTKGRSLSPSPGQGANAAQRASGAVTATEVDTS